MSYTGYTVICCIMLLLDVIGKNRQGDHGAHVRCCSWTRGANKSRCWQARSIEIGAEESRKESHLFMKCSQSSCFRDVKTLRFCLYFKG